MKKIVLFLVACLMASISFGQSSYVICNSSVTTVTSGNEFTLTFSLNEGYEDPQVTAGANTLTPMLSDGVYTVSFPVTNNTEVRIWASLSLGKSHVIFDGEDAGVEGYINPWWGVDATVEVVNWLQKDGTNTGDPNFGATIWRSNENPGYAGGGITLDLDISAYNKISVDISKRVSGNVQVELQNGETKAWLNVDYDANGSGGYGTGTWQTLVFDIPEGWTHLTALLVAPHNENTGENPINFDEDNERHRMSWDNIVLYNSDNHELVIPTGSSRPAGTYTNIIFNNNSQLTGIGEGGLTIPGVVKYKKTFAPMQWYAVGFPFALANSWSDFTDNPYLSIWNNSEGDFWVKSYDGVNNKFEYSTEMMANTGYIIQFPNAFTGKEVIFTSETGVTLKNITEGNLDEALALADNGYFLVANPSVSDLELSASAANKYYIYNSSTNNFGLLQSGSATVKPFESFVVAKGIESSVLRSSLNIQEVTALEQLQWNDPVVRTEYYNLQGMKVLSPAKNGLYIVKKTHTSGKTSTIKRIYPSNK